MAVLGYSKRKCSYLKAPKIKVSLHNNFIYNNNHMCHFQLYFCSSDKVVTQLYSCEMFLIGIRCRISHRQRQFLLLVLGPLSRVWGYFKDPQKTPKSIKRTQNLQNFFWILRIFSSTELKKCQELSSKTYANSSLFYIFLMK